MKYWYFSERSWNPVTPTYGDGVVSSDDKFFPLNKVKKQIGKNAVISCCIEISEHEFLQWNKN